MKKEAGRRRRKKWDTARQRRNKTKMFDLKKVLHGFSKFFQTSF